MTKEGIIGVGLVGVPFIIVGMLIGGFGVKKITDKIDQSHSNTMSGMLTLTKDLLIKSWEDNSKLKKKLSDNGIEA